MDIESGMRMQGAEGPRTPWSGWSETLADLRGAWRGDLDKAFSASASALTREIVDKQFMSMMPEMRNNLLITGVGIALLLIAIGSVAPTVYLLLWGAWGAATVAGSFVSHANFMRSPPAGEALIAWKASYRRGVFLVGCMWGSVMFLPQPPETLPYLAIGMLLVIAGSLSLFSMDRPAISLMSVPCGLFTSASLVLTGDVMRAVTGVGFAVAVALMVRLARVHNTAITQAMVIAEERKTLLEELSVQRREAEHANAAKTTFLASVSHDLRQPMHSIALLVEAARQRGHAEPDVVEQIGASVQSMDDLLNALLEVSKLDAGAVPLNLRAFSIADVLEPVRLKFDAQARAKGLRLELTAPSVRVHSDAFQLERIVSNLVANAIRYTVHGGVRVRCRQRGNTLWVQVWDSGIGIARQHRDKVFEEFFQVSRTSRTSRQGLGLGLAIVQRAVHRLGHAVRLRSREGRGSVFEVGVPLASLEDHHSIQLAPLLDGLLVLLVDDDRTVRQSMVSMLTAFNCQVLSAESVAEALEAVDQSLRLPDLIISDYRLTDTETGLDVIEQVRELAMEAIPALVVTAELGGRAADAALRSAGIPVVPKPLRADALASALKRLADDGAQRTESAGRTAGDAVAKN